MLVKFNPAAKLAKAAKAAAAAAKLAPKPCKPIRCGTVPPKLPKLPIIRLPFPLPRPRPVDDFCGTGPRPPFPPKLNSKIAQFAKAF